MNLTRRMNNISTVVSRQVITGYDVYPWSQEESIVLFQFSCSTIEITSRIQSTGHTRRDRLCVRGCKRVFVSVCSVFRKVNFSD
jgi:hypothetical protein